MILPSLITDKPYILISKDTYDRYMFLGTIIHELTHIHDFYDFAGHHNLQCFSDAENLDGFPPFLQWTEFHARRNRLLLLQKHGTDSARKYRLFNQQIHYIKNTITFPI